MHNTYEYYRNSGAGAASSDAGAGVNGGAGCAHWPCENAGLKPGFGRLGCGGEADGAGASGGAVIKTDLDI